MSIGLSIERNNESGPQQIALGEWFDIAAADPDLRISNEPLRTRHPQTGEVISFSAGPGASELRVRGEWLPFLRWHGGTLMGRYLEEMEAVDDPFRLKIAELSQKLGASIFVDVQDEPLDW